MIRSLMLFAIAAVTVFASPITETSPGPLTSEFAFSLDADSPADLSYSATMPETAGITVTLSTTGGTVGGVTPVAGQNEAAVFNSPVPEPASMFLMAAGLLGLGARRFRKRN